MWKLKKLGVHDGVEWGKWSKKNNIEGGNEMKHQVSR